MVDVEIELYEECKYHASREVLENPKKVRINNVTYWTIITGKDAEEIERYSEEASLARSSEVAQSRDGLPRLGRKAPAERKII